MDRDTPPLSAFMPDRPAAEPLIARAGAALADDAEPASREAVIDALHTVYDPEIPVDIYELGLIYDLDIGPRADIHIRMSLTTAGCPVADSMPGQVADTVAAVAGAGEVTVELVWDPPWTPERMSDDARLVLGM